MSGQTEYERRMRDLGRDPHRPILGPEPVGKKALRTLCGICQNGVPVESAPRQIERLRRAGYVDVRTNRAYVTEAGIALLTRTIHTDHPARHWDRTCPACVAQPATTGPDLEGRN